MKGILLLGHGSRNPEWVVPFQSIREAILSQQAGARVEMGFIELMRPTLDEGIASLVAQGVGHVVIVPIFMAAGSHVRKDLPLMAAAAMERHPGLAIQLADPVGEAPEVIDAMANYALNQ